MSLRLDVDKLNSGSKEDQLRKSLIDSNGTEDPPIFSPKQDGRDAGHSRMYSSMASIDDLNQQLEVKSDLEQVEEKNEVQEEQPAQPEVQKDQGTPADPKPTDAVTVNKADDIPNLSGKSIDFEQQLKAYKERNEVDLPFTLTQVEDSMYIDQYQVMTLEYHYYQNDCVYHELERCEEYINAEGKLCTMDGEEADHKLGTQDYQADPEKIHPMSSFARKGNINYMDSGVDLVKHQRSLGQDQRQLFTVDEQVNKLGQKLSSAIGNMMRKKTPPKSPSSKNRKSRSSTPLKNAGSRKTSKKKKAADDPLIEGIICLYKVDAKGGMQRHSQATVNIPGRKFFKSEDGNMVLSRSKDKKLVSLTNFDRFDDKKQYFKLQAWTIKLKPYTTPDNFERLHQSLNAYFDENQKSFDTLVELAFVGSGKFVQLIYIESKKRPLAEQQDYELQIKIQEEEKKKNVNPDSDVHVATSPRDSKAFEQRNLPRKAKKYVFFEVSTGNIVFKYGGIQTPFMTANGAGKQVKIYELGCLVREIREEEFNPQICFFFAGDFMRESIKEVQMTMTWAWNFATIGMKTLFDLQSQGDQTDYIHDRLKMMINESESNGYLNYYPFDSSWIEKQRFNWEINTQLANSRRFDQIAMLNYPVDRTEYAHTTYYVHGSKFKHMINIEVLEKRKYLLEVPLVKLLPNEAVVRHSRNQNIKDQLFYDQIKGHQMKTYCVRMDNKDKRKRVFSPKLNLNKQVSQHDVWLHFKKNYINGVVDDIFQTIHVEPGNQTGVLQTILPTSLRSLNSNDDDDIIERKTNMFYQQTSDMPCIAYNLGDNKIILQNIYQTEEKRKYILNIQEDEKFVCWLKFTHFQDIGFYANDLRIECCSHFAFLTTGLTAQNQQKNQINIIFIDPFYTETQVAHFKSTSYYDNDIFTTNDTIITSIVQSTMATLRDKFFKTYIWTQFPQTMVKSKVLNFDRGDLIDSDASEGEEEDLDEKEIKGQVYYDQVQMIQNDSDFIYYVTRLNGMCHIMEGNPREPKMTSHSSIFQIKANKCLAFTVEGDNTFFFMDENFVVLKLTRSLSNRTLNIEKELTMKEIFTLDFKVSDFNKVVLNDKYAIQGNKIFYLYETNDDEFPEGILESEDIVVEKRSKPKSVHTYGPFAIQGSKKVFNVYQVNKFKSHITIILKPDSTSQTIINDFQNFCDMSTFLENGNILIKCRRRFMMFDCCGRFLDEIDFNEDKLNDLSRDESDVGMTIGKMTTKHVNKTQAGFDKLMRRRKDDAILDFEGKPFQFKPIAGSPALNSANKLEIMNMSYNNRWYLFYNRMEEQFFVYELVTIPPGPDNPTTQYTFELTYQLDTNENFMFKHMTSIGVDPIAYFRDHMSQIKIDDEANVKLCFVENMPIADVKSEDSSGADTRFVQCRLVGTIFTPVEGELKMADQCFMQFFEFYRSAQEDLAAAVEENQNVLDRQLKLMRINQARIPKSLHNYFEYENMIDELIELENIEPNRVHAKIFCENLVVMYCGKYVTFGRLIPNKKKTKKSPKEVMDLVFQPSKDKKMTPFTPMNVQFGNSIEVIKIVETTRKNVLQIQAFDHEEKILSIITWDFDENVEVNLKQCVPNSNDTVAYNIVKGMNMKMNYLINQHHVIDLEYNIPIRQTSVDQQLDRTSTSYLSQLYQINNLFNQRKIYQDQSRFLGVEKPACLFYPLCRIDLILWWNMVQAGESSDLIIKSCSVENFNIVVDGVSILHYFAENADVIEKIQLMYNADKIDGKLSESNVTMPLQALNPDNDGKTALFRAVQRQSPKSFQCFVEMLIDFPELCVSKMMLKSLALVFSHESDSVINFFEQNVFKPPQMQQEFFLPWQDDLDAFVFPSHTSVISRHLLIDELNKQGIEASSGGGSGQAKVKKGGLEEKVDTIALRTERIIAKKNLRRAILEEKFDTGLPDGQKPEKRVQIEALDMDWIFEGNNAQTLLGLLATDANDQCLTKKSIKTFVDLMWTYYQPAIIKRIFIPYVVYLVALSLCAASLTASFLEAAENCKKVDDQGNRDPDTCPDDALSNYNSLKTQIYICNGIADVLLIFFASIELPQLIDDPKGYFSDPWNCIDAMSIWQNMLFLGTGTYCILTEKPFFEIQTIYSFGSFAVFFMWLKVFYWMRLFSSLAYYVKLIQATLYDSVPFMVMVALIIAAFGNYFYVIQNNLAETGDDTYYDSWFGENVSDVLVMVYLLGALGDFEPSNFNKGRDKVAALSMMLLATFIIMVVFMNMLIAIMGDTFGTVLEKSVETGIREQVVLISDHCWLLNLKKIFKGKKYVIRVTPSVGEGGESDPVEDQVGASKNNLEKRMNKLENYFNQKIDTVDVNTRFLLANQEFIVNQVKRKLNGFYKKYEGNVHEDKEEAKLPQEVQVQKKALEAKKKDVLSKINEQIGVQNVTIDTIQEVAMNWMAIADVDGSGELSLAEFSEFFTKIQGILITQEEIANMFEDFDGSGNGSLSCEEFARAIYMCLLADNREYSDSDEIDDQEDI